MRVVLILLFAVALKVSAQNFVTYSTKDGLSNDQVSCLLEDQQGYLWIGTGEGLNRFDGKHFKRYFYSPNDTASLAHDDVRALHQSADGFIWITSFGGGFGRFDPRTERFTSWEELTGLQAPSAEQVYSHIYSRHQDSLWVGIENHGVGLFLPKERRQVVFPIDFTNGKRAVRKIVADPSDSDVLWFVCDRTLLSFRISTGEMEHHHPPAGFPVAFGKKISCQDMYFLNEDEIWLATWGQGLVYWNRKTNVWKPYLLDEEAPFHGAKNVFKSILPLDEQRLLCGVEIGLAIFDMRARKFTKIEFDKNDPFALPDGYTGNLYRTKDGLIWAAARKGLVKWDPALNLFRTLRLPQAATSQLVTTARSGIEHEQQLLLASVLGDGLYKLEQGSKDFDVVDLSGKGEIEDVHDIHKLNDTTALVIMKGKAIVLDLNTMGSRPVFEDAIAKYGDINGLSFLLDPNENAFWIGKQNTGVFRYDLSDGSVRRFFQRKGEQHMARHWPQGLAFDRDSNIWVSGVEGISRISRSDHTLTNYQLKDYPRLETDYVWDLAIDSENMLWLGTNGKGLIRTDPLDVGGESTKNFTRFKGLPSMVSSLCVDPEGMLWIGGRSGLWRMDPRDHSLREFDRSDGLRSSDFHHANVTFTASGRVLVINEQGTIILSDLRDISDPAPRPNVRLTEVNVNGISVVEDTIDNYLKRLDLRYDQNYLELGFTSLTYAQRSQLKLAYKLEGADPEYKECGADQRTVYADLDPGSYRFTVMDMTSEAELLSFPIHIEPAIWQTTWFKALLILLWLVAGYFLFRWRMGIIRKNQHLELSFNKRLAEVEMKALRSQMNPHFLFNSLNSINRYIVKSEPRIASEYLTKFSRLMRAVLQNSKEKLVPLNDELDALRLYIDLEALRFKDKFQFTYNNHLSGTENEHFVPPLILQPYVENAIWHGLMHKSKGIGTLLLEVQEIEDGIQFMIEDNGVGRKKAMEMKSKSATKDRSFGMAITKERMDMARINHNFDMRVDVNDLVDDKGRPVGTRVSIIMMKKKES